MALGREIEDKTFFDQTFVILFHPLITQIIDSHAQSCVSCLPFSPSHLHFHFDVKLEASSLEVMFRSPLCFPMSLLRPHRNYAVTQLEIADRI